MSDMPAELGDVKRKSQKRMQKILKEHPHLFRMEQNADGGLLIFPLVEKLADEGAFDPLCNATSLTLLQLR